MSQFTPALRACQSHQQHLGVQEVPGIQDLRQVLTHLSHQLDPKDTQRRVRFNSSGQKLPSLDLKSKEGSVERVPCYLQQVQKDLEHQHHHPFQELPGNKHGRFLERMIVSDSIKPKVDHLQRGQWVPRLLFHQASQPHPAHRQTWRTAFSSRILRVNLERCTTGQVKHSQQLLWVQGIP